MTAQVAPRSVCLYRTFRSRQTNRYSSSRRFQISPSLSAPQPRDGAMRVAWIDKDGWGSTEGAFEERFGLGRKFLSAAPAECPGTHTGQGQLARIFPIMQAGVDEAKSRGEEWRIWSSVRFRHGSAHHSGRRRC